MRLPTILLLTATLTACVSETMAEDWSQFRGDQGASAGPNETIPDTWSDQKNLSWKTPLPGPGSSSPIVVGDRVLVTCFTGYGDESGVDDVNALVRHLVCLDRNTGEVQWKKTIPGTNPEDQYQGYLTEHGYASSTPVTDGSYVYCFFGKSGVFAFDLNGQQLWNVEVGTESSNRRWGSAASLILHGDNVIVNASEESQALIALNKKSGEEAWRSEAAALELTYGTPAIVTVDERRELVIAVPSEVWGLNPDTGKLLWYADHDLTGNICPSVIDDHDRVFVFGGYRSAGSFCVRAGGTKDVTDSNMIWTSRSSSYVATPVLHNEHLYWITDNGQAICMNANNGEQVYRERLPQIRAGGRPVYASPIVVGDKLIVPTRRSGTLVLAAKPEFEVLTHNVFEGDESDFNATAAVSNNQLFLRSDRFLYCVAESDKS